MVDHQQSLSFYNPNTGIYTSPRPFVSLPQSSPTSIVDFLLRNLHVHSNFPALIDPYSNQIITFSQLKQKISEFAQAVRYTFNISKNDVVLIFSPNSIHFVIAFLAVTSIGAIVTTSNPQYTIRELSHQISDSKPKLIITINQLHHKVKDFNLPILDLNNYYNIINKTITLNLIKDVPTPTSHNDVALILYSSGTTGLSKGVVLTHKSLIVSALIGTSDQEVYREGRNVYIVVIPLFHVMGLIVLMYTQLQRGDAIVVMERFELEKALDAMETYKVTHFYTPPPVVVAMVKQREVVKRYDMSELREIVCGAAPLGKDVMDECSKVFPQANISLVSFNIF